MTGHHAFTVLAAGHGSSLSRWLSARNSEISLVARDLAHHVRPPAGPSLTFAVFTVLTVIAAWKILILPALSRRVHSRR
jgi:hypothetical protein